MKSFLLIFVVLFSQVSLGQNIPRPNDLPKHVFLNNGFEAFTHRLYFALRKGRIWMKPNEIVTGIKSDWEIVPFSGLPSSADSLAPYPEVKFVKRIHADGDNLIAIDQNDSIYYAKISHLIGFPRPTKNLQPNWIAEFRGYFNGTKKRNPGGALFWKNKWGLAFLAKKFPVPLGNRAWSISHRGPYMEYYDDIDGNPHYISAGVTTLYALMKAGNEIQYIDPWLPPKWGKTAHKLYTPNQGRFIATNMTSSGSTLFIISQTGEMYTRLYDWDSAGHDPFLQYTFRRERNRGSNMLERRIIRTLPNEDWRKQPPIIGKITSLITIFQNGAKGSAGFTLRVEGRKNGRTGYFEKPIYASNSNDWVFRADDHKISRPFLLDGMSKLGPQVVKNFRGTLYLKGIRLEANLIDYHQEINPSYLELNIANQKFKLPLYTRMTTYVKHGYNTQATIVFPESFKNNQDPRVQRVYRNLFNGQYSMDFDISVLPDGRLSIKEDLHILGIDEVLDVFVRAFSKYHVEQIKHRVANNYGIKALEVRKSEAPSVIKRRLKMTFCPINQSFNSQSLLKKNCRLPAEEIHNSAMFIQGQNLAKVGEKCMRNDDCYTDRCDNNIVERNAGSFRCIPLDGFGDKGDYCARDSHCESARCLKNKCQ
ncbi:MAG: hypothetical protein ACO20H_04465 [Bacteriovoracaceae bacterium]